MAATFLITLREGLEAALIVSILLAYLARTGNRSRVRDVWLGTAVAMATSLVAGGVIFWTAGELTGRAEQIFEGAAMLLAVTVLSYMIIWMRRQARDIKHHLEAELKTALVAGSALALAVLAFLVVVREGIETALFLFGAMRGTDPLSGTVGGIAGLAVAVAIGYAGYRGARWLNLSTFFNITGGLLILFAAGLLAHGIHEFQEAALLPLTIEHVWDTNGVLNESAGLGSFLKALFGYNGNPSLLEVVFYFGYLAVAFWSFFRSARPAGKVSRKPEHEEARL
ncbi:MAG: FTR1 family iron permease [Chloroflexi bacterium]|nr:FTR1 family iron permease [Chloroflexota bacterium]